MNGQPYIRGMRLTVRRVVEAVALYPDRKDLKEEYPELDDEDIRQALEFAANNLNDEFISRITTNHSPITISSIINPRNLQAILGQLKPDSDRTLFFEFFTAPILEICVIGRLHQKA